MLQPIWLSTGHADIYKRNCRLSGLHRVLHLEASADQTAIRTLGAFNPIGFVDE
jgi:hypothetical protein